MRILPSKCPSDHLAGETPDALLCPWPVAWGPNPRHADLSSPGSVLLAGQ